MEIFRPIPTESGRERGRISGGKNEFLSLRLLQRNHIMRGWMKVNGEILLIFDCELVSFLPSLQLRSQIDMGAHTKTNLFCCPRNFVHRMDKVGSFYRRGESTVKCTCETAIRLLWLRYENGGANGAKTSLNFNGFELLLFVRLEPEARRTVDTKLFTTTHFTQTVWRVTEQWNNGSGVGASWFIARFHVLTHFKFIVSSIHHRAM